MKIEYLIDLTEFKRLIEIDIHIMIKVRLELLQKIYIMFNVAILYVELIYNI